MSWPDGGFAPPSGGPESLRARFAGLAGAMLILGGAVAVGVAIAAQSHAPQPSLTAAGATGPAGQARPLRHSMPVSIDIPAIGVHSRLLRLGVKADGKIAVPPLFKRPSEAAWYKYSVTPGERGTSLIEGHVDNFDGPAVFFRLGALRPGDRVDVALADGITAVFRVTGVRQYLKSRYPAKVIYRTTRYAALRLITCGGAFDYTTRQYLSSTVVFAALTSSRPTRRDQATS